MKAFLLMVFGVVSIGHAAVDPIISSGTNSVAQPRSTWASGLNFLSHDQMVEGLREALTKGVQQAVMDLGHDGGFLTNLPVRIQMPQQLQTVERTLRTLGQGQLADEFVATMNHAAEQAVPQAAAVFVDAVQHMTIADAETIVTGPDDAATQYFRRTTQTNLYQKFLPIVKSATDRTGVTGTYKRLMGTAGQNKYLGTLESILMNNQALDIDDYITERALDGLFKTVGQEEKRIRKDPVARTSELLQRVFGAVSGR